MAKVSVGDLINKKKASSGKKYDISDIDELLGGQSSNWKPQKYLKFNENFEAELNHPEGLIALGHTTMIMGHSNSGKGAVLIEIAKYAQRTGILPIFLITELKWSMDRLLKSGFEMEVVEEVDESTGEVSINYKGDFIYRDSESLYSIDAVGEFMEKCLELQKKGKLQRDIIFLWDSAGVSKSEKSLDSDKGNNMFDAGTMASWFQRRICPAINLTRKASSKYSATFVISNHVWVNSLEFGKPPLMMPSGGNALYKMASCVIAMGDVTRAGTALVSATKSGKKVDYGLATKISLPKWHNDESPNIKSKIIIVGGEEGFISNTSGEIAKYVKAHSKDWLNKLKLSEEEDDEFETILTDMDE